MRSVFLDTQSIFIANVKSGPWRGVSRVVRGFRDERSNDAACDWGGEGVPTKNRRHFDVTANASTSDRRMEKGTM